MVDAGNVGGYRGVQACWCPVRIMVLLQHSGVVIGCLTKDGRIDMGKNRRLIEAARPLRYACIAVVMVV